MRPLLQLAAVAAALTATTAHAQIINPDKMVAKPPANPAKHYDHHSSTSVQWMFKYTEPTPHGDQAALMQDSRFPTLLHTQLRAPQSFFRNGLAPLDEVATRYLGITTGDVAAEGNRYITVSGCVPDLCSSKGLLFVDTLNTHPLVVFAATEWTTTGKSLDDPAANFNLWIFPGAALDPEHPPFALTQAISRWNSTAAQHIETAILVDPDGTPHKVDPSLFGATSSKTN